MVWPEMISTHVASWERQQSLCAQEESESTEEVFGEAMRMAKVVACLKAPFGKSVHLQAPSGSHEVSSSSRVYLIGLQKGIGHDVNVDMSSFPLLSDDFDDDPFGALPIEFAVEESLPRTKVDPASGDGQDHLVMQ